MMREKVERSMNRSVSWAYTRKNEIVHE